MQTSQIILQTVADVWIMLAISVAFGSIFVSNPLREEKNSEPDTPESEEDVAEVVERFRSRLEKPKLRMMMNEVEMEFIEMAQGGDGSIAELGNIREEHYSDKEDTFFQAVCDALGWDWMESKDR